MAVVVEVAAAVLGPAEVTNFVGVADSPVAADSDAAEAADTSHPAFSAPELPPHDQLYLY